MNLLRSIRAATLAGLIMSAGAEAAVYTVGADFQCTHSTIQAALDAAVDNPGRDTIRIANNQTYTAQALTKRRGSNAGGSRLEVIGGFSDCSDLSPSGNTVISGQGGVEASVLTIEYGENVLVNLTLIRGDASMIDGQGGGIRFLASSMSTIERLELYNVVLSQNKAAFGGGLDAKNGSVVIGPGTQFVLNTAQFSGGAIRIHGDANIAMSGADNIAINNEALGINPSTNQPSGGYGGAVLIEAPATATLRFDAPGGVSGNLARYGGGIAIRNQQGNGNNLAVSIGAPDSLVIANNVASVAGGGLWVEGSSTDGTGSDVEVCLSNFRFEGNSAPSGAAIHAGLLGAVSGGDPSRARVALNENCSGGNVEPTNVPCALAGTCNRFIGHVGNMGSLLQLGPGARLDAQRVAFSDNQVQRLIDAAAGETIFLRTCAATRNTLATSLLRVRSPLGAVTFDECTVADNSIGGSFVLEFPDGGALALRNAILWQPGKLMVSAAGGGNSLGATVQAVMVSERSTLPELPAYIDGPPAFNDPAMSDYRLRIASPAVDAANTRGGFDLLLQPRDRQIRPDASVIRDIGAFERQQNAPLLVNATFAGNLSAWSVRSSPYTTYDALNNDGADGSGSVLVSIPIEVAASMTEAEVLSQCFNVPFAGVYSLSARASANGTAQTRDVPKLYWRLRDNSADCTGPVSAQGVTFFPGAGSSFASATASEITVPSATFGPSTSIEVLLAVGHNSNAIGSLQARFDNPELRILSGPLLPYPVFADGFE